LPSESLFIKDVLSFIRVQDLQKDTGYFFGHRDLDRYNRWYSRSAFFHICNSGLWFYLNLDYS